MASDIYPEQPVILLGTGIENRKLTKQARKRLHLRRVGSGALGEPISRQEGKDLAKKVGACKYLECSTSTGEGVSEVLEYAVRMALSYTPPKKKKWFSLTRNK
ncbi:ras-like protein family, member A [Xylogone sp. PMI_703]|nr:ras-like protein family, member A [Xylogone sp. PMI_703]